MNALEGYGPWALVTGASDGIGRAMAGRIAAAGLNVVVAARRAGVLRDLAGELERNHGVQVRVMAVDLADPAARDRFADELEDLDIGLAVLAAGFGTTGPFIRSPLADELDMVAVNITAITRLTHTLGGRMAIRGSGGIVLFGSILGWQGVTGQANYAATKAYVQSLAEGLRPELAAHGVDVLAVAPGPVNTGFAARAGMTMDAATSADVVAAAALRALGRRVTVYPGARTKLLTGSLRILPRSLRSSILSRVVDGMRAV